MPGSLIAWTELTTDAGADVSAFYSKVLDVPVTAFDMGGYDDYNVPGDEPSFGICDPRSSDDALRPGWIVYLRVKDLGAALETAKRLGAQTISPPRHTKGYGAHAVIRDPAGNLSALYKPDGER